MYHLLTPMLSKMFMSYFLSIKTIGQFLIKQTNIHFLTTNAGLALALRCYTHYVITLKGCVLCVPIKKGRVKRKMFSPNF